MKGRARHTRAPCAPFLPRRAVVLFQKASWVKLVMMVNCTIKKRQNAKSTIHRGLTLRSCPREFSRSAKQNVMIKLTSAALAYVRQPGFSALLFTDVKPPEGQAAAYKQKAVDDLHQMGLTVLAEHIFYGKPTGRRSERTTMAVVAQSTDATDRWLRSILSGRPLDGSW